METTPRELNIRSILKAAQKADLDGLRVLRSVTVGIDEEITEANEEEAFQDIEKGLNSFPAYSIQKIHDQLQEEGIL